MQFPGVSFIRNALTGARKGPVLSILIFHRVLGESEPLNVGSVTEPQFASIIRLVRKSFECFPLSQAVTRLDAGVPGHMLAVTFDDGYADNYEIALPVLKRFGVPATIFIATGYLDGGIMWNDRIAEAISRTTKESVDLEDLGEGVFSLADAAQRENVRRTIIASLKYRPAKERDELARRVADQLKIAPRQDLMLRREQVAALGRESMIEIGGHTHSHPILTCTDSELAAHEMTCGKRELEAITNKAVRGFAYPNGQPGRDYGPEHVALAEKAGFSFAVSTQWGAARAETDRFQLPRFTPWRRGYLGFTASLLKVARTV